MRIHVDFTIPRWTQWLTAGVALGVMLSVGAARVSAEPIAQWKTWLNGDVITAADLNGNFSELKKHVEALEESQPRLRIDSSSCVSSGSMAVNVGYTDCTCQEGEIAISGGAYAGPYPRRLAESRNLQSENVRSWRVACDDQGAGGARVPCQLPFVICMKLTP